MTTQMDFTRGRSRRSFIAHGGAACLTMAGGYYSVFAQARRTKIQVALTFVAMGRFAAFYLAKKRGYYQDAGLDVTITAAGSNALGYQMLTTGAAQVCIGDIAQMLQLQGRNPEPKMKSLGVIYAKEPMACFYRMDRGITKPKDLEGKTIADGAGSVGNTLFPIFAQANGIDAEKVKWKFASASAKLGLLFQGDVDAVMTYVLGLPGIEKNLRAGERVGYFLYGDYGVDVYGDGVITTDAFLNAEPAAAKAFTKATFRALKETFADPRSAVDAMAQEVLTLDRDTALREIELVKGLALQEVQVKNGLGYHDPQKMQSTWDAIVNVLKQPIAKPVAEFYTNEAL